VPKRNTALPPSWPPRYVAVLQAPDGTRLFCCDSERDEWTGRFGLAKPFPSLHEALGAAGRHGGIALPWQEAFEMAA